jgi:hypothetical protein
MSELLNDNEYKNWLVELKSTIFLSPFLSSSIRFHLRQKTAFADFARAV